MNELFDLTGKVAIVSGARRGLGKAMGIGLAEAGANVVVADILDTKETVDEIRGLGKEAIGIKADVSKKADVVEMVQRTVDKFERVDILVNNAGIHKLEPAENLTEDNWDKTLAVNLKAQFLCAQAVSRYMIKQNSGKIINVSSTGGLVVSGGSAPYNASKAGVILLTKTLAVEWAKYNINVNAVCPAFIMTEMLKEYLELAVEDPAQLMQTKIPLGRGAEPEEMIGTIVYLASKASDFMTGHTLVFDGGTTAGL